MQHTITHPSSFCSKNFPQKLATQLNLSTANVITYSWKFPVRTDNNTRLVQRCIRFTFHHGSVCSPVITTKKHVTYLDVLRNGLDSQTTFSIKSFMWSEVKTGMVSKTDKGFFIKHLTLKFESSEVFIQHWNGLVFRSDCSICTQQSHDLIYNIYV